MFISKFKHTKTGNIYGLLMIANAATTDGVKFPVTAVYQSIADDRIWCRPIRDFKDKFTKVDEG